jgi:hypothetical protein
MSFLRDRKEKPFESKARMYFEGLRQRADNLKKYAQDDDEKPLILSYNLYKTLIRLKELRDVFFNNETVIEPKSFLKDMDENDIRYAIREKLLTIREVSAEIEMLENIVIQIMHKTLVHLETLPLMREEEFAKSDNEEYLTDLYSSTLNQTVLANCEKYLLILTDSKEKNALLLSLQHLQNKFTIRENHSFNNIEEDVELTDDEMSDDENDPSLMDHDEFFEDRHEEKQSNVLDEKEIPPAGYSEILNQSSSINLDDSLRWSQFPLDKSKISVDEEKKHAPSPPRQPPPMANCTIWYKLGVLLSTTLLSALGGLVISLFFTGGFAVPVAVGVSACLGFMLGLKLIYSKQEQHKKIYQATTFSSENLNNHSTPSIEASLDNRSSSL